MDRKAWGQVWRCPEGLNEDMSEGHSPPCEVTSPPSQATKHVHQPPERWPLSQGRLALTNLQD